MVCVLHILECEKCEYKEESYDENFGIDDILEFTAECDECGNSEHCHECINVCKKDCGNNFCDNCIEDHKCDKYNNEVDA